MLDKEQIIVKLAKKIKTSLLTRIIWIHTISRSTFLCVCGMQQLCTANTMSSIVLYRVVHAVDSQYLFFVKKSGIKI